MSIRRELVHHRLAHTELVLRRLARKEQERHMLVRMHRIRKTTSCNRQTVSAVVRRRIFLARGNRMMVQQLRNHSSGLVHHKLEQHREPERHRLARMELEHHKLAHKEPVRRMLARSTKTCCSHRTAS